jgi:hypothetical protein
MKRTTLGLVALFLLVIGGITALSGPASGSAAGFAGGCIRVGLVLGAVWLALPQIKALAGSAPRWLLGWFMKRGTQGQANQQPLTPKKRPRRRSRA